MPTHYTPLQTPTDISSPLLSTPSRSDRYSPSNPGSSSPSTPSSRRSQPSHRKHGGKKATETDEPKTATEAPYLFLGSIAAASLLAHKYWPKGFLYGPKEDWELAATKSAPRSKQRRVAESVDRGGRGRSEEGEWDLRRGRLAGPGCDYRCAGCVSGEGRRERWREYVVEEEEEAVETGYTGRGWDRSRAGTPSWEGNGSRRSRAWDSSSSSFDRYSELSSGGPAGTRERSERVATTEWCYYRSLPERRPLLGPNTMSTIRSSSGRGAGSRYPLERSKSSAGSERSDLSRPRFYDDYDHPLEVEYPFQKTRAAPRRASFGARGARRHEGDCCDLCCAYS